MWIEAGKGELGIGNRRSIRILSRLVMLLFVVALIAGCGLPLDDALWVQQQSVPIGKVNFEQCVMASVAQVPGVSIDKELAGPQTKYMIALNVKLEKPIPHLGVQVQHRDNGTAVIMFSHKLGWLGEPDEARKEITPVLQSIADALKRNCGS